MGGTHRRCRVQGVEGVRQDGQDGGGGVFGETGGGLLGGGCPGLS